MEDICTPSQALGQVPARDPAEDASAAPQARWGSHPVDIRVTIPLLFRSYYVTVVIGPERRSEERRAIERRKHPLLTLGNATVYLVSGAGWLLFLTLLYRLVALGV